MIFLALNICHIPNKMINFGLFSVFILVTNILKFEVVPMN